ncbi:hypothetical protein ACFODL_20265 [Phenylobacterium terrae]|uniref:YfhO family protein n=1 Tax=Phenylobacterium terrae TaxID=2665495 RepID=A0ABW4MZ93_9CAUL
MSLAQLKSLPQTAIGGLNPIRIVVVAAALVLGVLAPSYFVLNSIRAVAGAYSPTPFFDQWGVVFDYASIDSVGDFLAVLFRQSNEHRILFPRLIFFTDLYVFRGGNVLNLASTFAVQAASLALLARLAWDADRKAASLILAGLAAALMFSFGQWENFLWGFQVQFVLVYAAGAGSIYLFYRAFAGDGRPDYRTWAASLLLLVVSAFSMANGVIAGAAAVAVGLLARLPARALGLHAAATGLVLAIYLIGYQGVPGHSKLDAVLTTPLLFAEYVATYLGNLARFHGLPESQALGAVGLILALAAAARVALGRDKSPERLALVGVMAFIIATAMVTGAGRLGFGLLQAFSSRYLTPTSWFWAVQAIFWLPLIAARLRLANFAATAAVALAALVFLYDLQVDSRPDFYHRATQTRAASDILLTGANDPEPLLMIHWDMSLLDKGAGILRDRRLSLYREGAHLWVGRRIDQVATLAGREACLGAFDVLETAPKGAALRGLGWAWDVADDRPVDRIVVTDGGGVVIGLGGASFMPRGDVMDAVDVVDEELVGWSAVIRRPKQPEIVAYAALRDGRMCEIGRKAVP